VSSAYSRNYAEIDWSDLKPTPARIPRQIKDRTAFHVIRDIEPYASPVTGEMIGGRRQHREHLRDHGLIEMGNEKPKGNRLPSMPSAAQDIAIEMKKRGIIG
jgi:hypothetical protein